MFLVDTGSNTHIVSNKSSHHDFRKINPVHINGNVGTSARVTATQTGSTTINCTTIDGRRRTVVITNVLLVPEAGVNLLAVSNLSKDGARFSGANTQIKLTNEFKDYIITGSGSNGL